MIDRRIRYSLGLPFVARLKMLLGWPLEVDVHFTISERGDTNLNVSTVVKGEESSVILRTT